MFRVDIVSHPPARRPTRPMRKIASFLALSLLAAGCETTMTDPAASPAARVDAGQSTASDRTDGHPTVIVSQSPATDRSASGTPPIVDNLAEALNRVRSGGTIRVLPGTYVASEPQVLRPVSIVGIGQGPTLVPPDPRPERSVALTVSADGNTAVRNLRFSGFNKRST